MIACAASAQPGWSPNDLAQLQPAAASSGATFDPGTVYQAYWKPSAGNYTTNSGTTTLADLGGGGYHLTNTTAANVPTRVEAGFDGQDYLNFDGTTDYLRQIALTNSQPFQIWSVLSFNGSETSTRLLFDSTTSTKPATAYQYTTSWYMSAGSAIAVSGVIPQLTNRWLLYQWQFDGASCKSFTNGVLLLSGNAGANARDGLTLGMSRALTLPTSMHVAWFGVVSSNLTAGSASSNLSYLYFKSNWPSLNLP